MKWNHFKLIPILVGVSFLVISCGKKAQNSKPRESTNTQLGPIITNMDSYLEKQEIGCESAQGCPNYIAKVAVVHGQTVKFCTGFLINNYTLATSASCLPRLLKLANQDCSKDVFFYFSKSFNGLSERVGCKRVVQVSATDSDNPIFWRDDVAYLELDKQVYYRRSLIINRDGLQEGGKFSVWGIDQIDDYSAFIRRKDCHTIYDSYINPLASDESSPGMVFGGCDSSDSNSGAPILDSRGRVRGLVSQKIDIKIRKYLESTGLLLQPLKEMFHATNFACAPTIYDTYVLNEKECTKDLNSIELDKRRDEMMNFDGLFTDYKKKLEKNISEMNKFLMFQVTSMQSHDNIQEVEIAPKCFKNVASWVYTLGRGNNVFEMTFPKVHYKRGVDADGKVVASETILDRKRYFLQFSPKSLKYENQSTIYIWNDDESKTFRDVPSC